MRQRNIVNVAVPRTSPVSGPRQLPAIYSNCCGPSSNSLTYLLKYTTEFAPKWAISSEKDTPATPHPPLGAYGASIEPPFSGISGYGPASPDKRLLTFTCKLTSNSTSMTCSNIRSTKGHMVTFRKRINVCRYEQESCAIAKTTARCGCRHLGFVRTVNSAIRPADPENPTLEPNMKWIGSPVAEMPFAYLGGIWNPHLGGRGGRRGQRGHH